MIPPTGVLILLTLFGGAVAVDGTSLGQFMLSRPVVAATLAGWIAGSPAQGALVGLVLEAFHLTVLPVGAARYPEGAPPAVAAAGAYAGTSHSFSALLVVVVFSLVWERLSGWSVQATRQFNVRFSIPPGTAAVSPGRMARGHLLAVLLDFVRGALFSGVGLVVIGWILREGVFLLPHGTVARLALGVALSASAGAALHLFGLARMRLFLAGAVAGLLLLLLLR